MHSNSFSGVQVHDGIEFLKDKVPNGVVWCLNDQLNRILNCEEPIAIDPPQIANDEGIWLPADGINSLLKLASSQSGTICIIEGVNIYDDGIHAI